MARRKVRRLHSDDARFLRSMFVDVMERVFMLEVAVGELQRGELAKRQLKLPDVLAPMVSLPQPEVTR